MTEAQDRPRRRRRRGRRSGGDPAAPEGGPPPPAEAQAELAPAQPAAPRTRRRGSGSRDDPGHRDEPGRRDEGARRDDSGRSDGRDSERGWRELAGIAPSQVGLGGALRARDVARPTAEDLAAAERTVVVVRRQWQPPEG